MLALGALLGSCAHAASGKPGTADAQAESKKPVRVVVTGSRIPSYVEPGSQALPTYAPLRVYSQDELRSTGRDGDLGAALQALDPSITHR